MFIIIYPNKELIVTKRKHILDYLYFVSYNKQIKECDNIDVEELKDNEIRKKICAIKQVNEMVFKDLDLKEIFFSIPHLLKRLNKEEKIDDYGNNYKLKIGIKELKKELLKEIELQKIKNKEKEEIVKIKLKEKEKTILYKIEKWLFQD